MTFALGCRIFVALFGVGMLSMSFLSFVKKKMIEGIGLAWGLFSICLIMLAFVPEWFEWIRHAAFGEVIFLMVLLVYATIGIFGLCRVVSMLVMRNRELAMQVSLLNQEHEQFMREFKRIQEALDSKTGE